MTRRVPTVKPPAGDVQSVKLSFANGFCCWCCWHCAAHVASPGNSGWDDIIVGTQAVPIRFCFNASTCPRGQLRSLFHSNFNASVQFERQPVPPIDAACCMLLTLQPNSIYTLSTIATAVKGNHSIDPVVRPDDTPVRCPCACACVHVRACYPCAWYSHTVLIRSILRFQFRTFR